MNNNIDQLFSNFDSSKEKIPRQVTSIVSMREVWGTTQRKTLSEKIATKEIVTHKTSESNFDIEREQNEIAPQGDPLRIAEIIAKYRYTVNNHYFSDIVGLLYVAA